MVAQTFARVVHALAKRLCESLPESVKAVPSGWQQEVRGLLISAKDPRARDQVPPVDIGRYDDAITWLEQNPGFSSNEAQQKGLADNLAVLRDVLARLVVSSTDTQRPQPEEEAQVGTQIFISHSSRDKDVAAALIRLLEESLDGVPDGAIRCTSVDGYKLDVGAAADETLRSNLASAQAVIGLLSPTSLASHYVVMELGAAWGLRKTTCPVLCKGAGYSEIPTPIRSTHAIKATDGPSMSNLVEVVSRATGIAHRSNAARVAKALETYLQAAKSTDEKDQAPTQASAAVIDRAGISDKDAVILVRDHLENTDCARRPVEYAGVDHKLGLAAGTTKRLLKEAIGEKFDIENAGDSFVRLRSRPARVRDVRSGRSRWDDADF